MTGRLGWDDVSDPALPLRLGYNPGMRNRVDARALSESLESPSAWGAELEAFFTTLVDIDHSILETLAALAKDRTPRLPPTTRFAFFKRSLLRVLKVYTRSQESFNHNVLDALTKMRRRQSLLEGELRRLMTQNGAGGVD